MTLFYSDAPIAMSAKQAECQHFYVNANRNRCLPARCPLYPLRPRSLRHAPASVMNVGNLVVVLADPMLWGAGQIRTITTRGRLVVEFADLSREEFWAHELELLVRWQRSPCTITDFDLDELRQAA